MEMEGRGYTIETDLIGEPLYTTFRRIPQLTLHRKKETKGPSENEGAGGKVLLLNTNRPYWIFL
jgi:hypothetical protein